MAELEEAKYTVEFISHHLNGEFSNDYVIYSAETSSGETVTPPDFTGDEGYTFVKWDSNKYEYVTANTIVYALCRPNFDTLLSLTNDEVNTLFYDYTLNNDEFNSLVWDADFIERLKELLTVSRPYVKQSLVKVGKDADSEFNTELDTFSTSDLEAHNPEFGENNDEAAANSIVNVKNIDIEFHPKAYYDESKAFIINKVMPYLKQMVPSTAIFSYHFGSESGDTILKESKIVEILDTSSAQKTFDEKEKMILTKLITDIEHHEDTMVFGFEFVNLDDVIYNGENMELYMNGKTIMEYISPAVLKHYYALKYPGMAVITTEGALYYTFPLSGNASASVMLNLAGDTVIEKVYSTDSYVKIGGKGNISTIELATDSSFGIKEEDNTLKTYVFTNNIKIDLGA